MLFAPDGFPRIVVKIGSALLVDAAGAVRRDWLATLVADIAERRAAGQQVAIVSSGSIALGARRLDLARGGRASLEDAQAAAAVGQIALAQAWAELLGRHDLVAAQMLVTLGDLEERRRYLNAAATLARRLRLGAVPVFNENDSGAAEEIRVGDNDRLAARVAQAANASALVLLSDVDGLYDADPTTDPAARHVPHVARIDDVTGMAASTSTSGMGSGGMASKIAAARIAAAAGIPMAIASGRIDHPLEGERRHTLFAADRTASARKAWLAGGLTAAGTIRIDAGAAAALAAEGSLLAAGVVAVEGGFARGDLVAIAGPSGPFARGLAEYDAAETRALAGRRRDEHAAILGDAPRAAVVHRSHLALL